MRASDDPLAEPVCVMLRDAWGRVDRKPASAPLLGRTPKVSPVVPLRERHPPSQRFRVLDGFLDMLVGMPRSSHLWSRADPVHRPCRDRLDRPFRYLTPSPRGCGDRLENFSSSRLDLAYSDDGQARRSTRMRKGGLALKGGYSALLAVVRGFPVPAVPGRLARRSDPAR
jgi:hypothetical protein